MASTDVTLAFSLSCHDWLTEPSGAEHLFCGLALLSSQAALEARINAWIVAESARTWSAELEAYCSGGVLSAAAALASAWACLMTCVRQPVKPPGPTGEQLLIPVAPTVSRARAWGSAAAKLLGDAVAIGFGLARTHHDRVVGRARAGVVAIDDDLADPVVGALRGRRRRHGRKRRAKRAGGDGEG